MIGLGLPGRPTLHGNTAGGRDDWSLEYLPLDLPYNIVSFFDPGGHLKYHFCNVLTDARLDGSVLSYVDLDLDVVVTPDGGVRVEDEDQFERNSAAMGYPPEVRALALGAVEELVSLARAGGHVFGCSTLEAARHRLLGRASEPPPA